MPILPVKSYYDPLLDAMVIGQPKAPASSLMGAVTRGEYANAPAPSTTTTTTAATSASTMGGVGRGEYPVSPVAPTTTTTPAPTVPVTTYPKKGTILGYEFTPNKTMRKPQLADGNGGYTLGSWERNPDYVAGNGNTDGSGNPKTTDVTGPTTNVDVLKAMLKATGFSSSLVDSGTTFLSKLLKDGLDYDNAVQVFLNTKDYTFKDGSKLQSPFYTEYGYLNEGLLQPKGADELFNAIEGYKGIREKYNLSDKFTSKEALAKYVKNNISVAALDERAGMARLKAINSDAAYTDALQKLGFIKTPADLTDFFLNPDIGEQELKDKRNLAAFSAEAVRRAKTGITFDSEKYKQIVAGMTAKGLTEEQIATTAATGFENIGQDLQPLVGLSGMFERGAFTTEEQRQQGVQSELIQQEFLGTASERRKRLAEQNVRRFQGSAGTISSMYPTLAGASLRTTPLSGAL